MDIASDFRGLLKQADVEDRDDRPIYYLWTWDPAGNDGNGKVHMDTNEGKHPADHITHDELAPHVYHPERVHGYAYSIKGGWRINTDDHKEVDPGVVTRVMRKLRGEHPEPALPSVLSSHSVTSPSKLPTHRSWEGMLARCLNPDHVAYARYGGRGIQIHPSWLQYEVFLPQPTAARVQGA